MPLLCDQFRIFPSNPTKSDSRVFRVPPVPELTGCLLDTADRCKGQDQLIDQQPTRPDLHLAGSERHHQLRCSGPTSNRAQPQQQHHQRRRQPRPSKDQQHSRIWAFLKASRTATVLSCERVCLDEMMPLPRLFAHEYIYATTKQMMKATRTMAHGFGKLRNEQYLGIERRRNVLLSLFF